MTLVLSGSEEKINVVAFTKIYGNKLVKFIVSPYEFRIQRPVETVIYMDHNFYGTFFDDYKSIGETYEERKEYRMKKLRNEAELYRVNSLIIDRDKKHLKLVTVNDDIYLEFDYTGMIIMDSDEYMSRRKKK